MLKIFLISAAYRTQSEHNLMICLRLILSIQQILERGTNKYNLFRFAPVTNFSRITLRSDRRGHAWWQWICWASDVGKRGVETLPPLLNVYHPNTKHFSFFPVYFWNMSCFTHILCFTPCWEFVIGFRKSTTDFSLAVQLTTMCGSYLRLCWQYVNSLLDSLWRKLLNKNFLRLKNKIDRKHKNRHICSMNIHSSLRSYI